jgi:two-component system, NarL family, nitrate/nitrite response regulator NarL
MALRLLVIDDHPLFLEGMVAVLRRLDADIVVHKATTAELGLELAEHESLDLVLIDLNLPGIDGFTAIGEFHSRFPSLPVVVLSAMEREQDMQRAIEAGALGYIPKSSTSRTLFEALRQVQEGNIYLPDSSSPSYIGIERRVLLDESEKEAMEELSIRQMEVLARLCQGMSNKAIANDLELAEKTVKSHVTIIFRALGVVNRTQAVLAAKRMGVG